MSNGNKRLAALAQREPMKIHRSVFGDHPMHMSPRGYNTGSGIELNHNAGNRSVLCRRGKGQNRFSTTGERCPPDKIHLSSDAGIDRRTKRIRADLPGQIHLQGTVDGHEPIKLPQQIGVVRHITGKKFHQRVVIDKIKEPSATRDETGDNATRENAFGDW